MTPILGKPQTTQAKASAWAIKNHATWVFKSLVPLYWWHGNVLGVRPEVAYAQAAKETGFGRFGGVIDETFHNPCGLKTAAGGGNYDPEAHTRFPDWPVGVLAHVEHLGLYAGGRLFPRPAPADPRHFPYLLGKATTVEDLGGRWAPSLTYGTSLATLVTRLMES